MNVIAFSKTVLRISWGLVRILSALLLAAPWFVIRTTRFGVAAVQSFAGAPLRLLAATKDEVTCRRCCRRQSLLGRWRCPICKAIESTHAWAPCMTCRTEIPAGYVACEDPNCGEAIQNPKFGGVS